MAPAILTLHRHLRDSAATLEEATPHEARFRAKYMRLLRDALHALQNPDLANVAGFEQAFEPLRAVTRAVGDDCR